jgi:hypothetical protein
LSKTKQKDLFDKFYTKYDIADSCIKELLKFVKEVALFIEPSAGKIKAIVSALSLIH